MSVAEANQVLKRMDFSPLQPAGGSRFVSRSGQREARLTFERGLIAGEIEIGTDISGGFDCRRPVETPPNG
jgi:hypothetical protein